MSESPKLKRVKRRIRLITAGVTAFLVVVSSVAGWVLFGGVDAWTAGTLASLRVTGDAGAWRTLSAELKVSGSADGSGAKLGGFGDVVKGEGAGPVSWIVQVRAKAVDGDAQLRLREGTGEPVPLLSVAAGGSASTSVMLTSVGEVAPVILSDVAVEVAVETVAYFVPPGGEQTPEPGGSVATDAFALVDTAQDLGASLDDARKGAQLSPLGMGGVPLEGVAAVWLQVQASGDAAEVAFGSGGDDTPETVFGQSSAGLVPVRLDGDGQFWLRVSTQTSSVSVSVVGWLAGSQHDAELAVIDDGLMVGGPFAVNTLSSANGAGLVAPAAAPEGAVSLFSVSYDAGKGGRLGGLDGQGRQKKRGVMPTDARVAGKSSAIVAAESEAAVFEKMPEAVTVSWLGFFSGSAAQTGSTQVELQIISPKQDEQIDLVEQHGLVTFSGTVKAPAGLRSVHILRGNRVVGSAEVRINAEGYSWEYRSSTPFGVQQLEVVARDESGGEAKASVSYRVPELDEGELMIAENVAVIGDDLMGGLEKVTPETLVFAEKVFVQPGDIVSLPVSELTPDGALRRIVSVQRVKGRQVLGTEMATIADVLLNGRVRHEGLLVETTQDLDEVSSPESSGYADELGTGGENVSVAGGARASGSMLGSARSGRSGIPKRFSQRQKWQQTLNETEIEISLAHNFDRVGKKQHTRDGAQGRSPLEESVVLESRVASQGGSLTGSFKLPLSDLGGGEKKKTGGVKKKKQLSGSFNMSTTIVTKMYVDVDIDVEYRNIFGFQVFKKIRKLELVKRDVETRKVSVTGQGEFQVGIGGAPRVVDGELQKKTQQHHTPGGQNQVRIGTVVIPIGPVPVPISFYLEFAWSGDLTLSGSLNFSTAWSSVQEVGFSYENGEVKPVSRASKTSEGSTSVQASFGLNGSLNPKFEIRIAELVGGYIALNNKVSGTATVFLGDSHTASSTTNEQGKTTRKQKVKSEGSIEVLVRYTMDFTIGVRFTVFGLVDLFDFQYDHKLIDWEIFRKKWSLGDNPDSVEDVQPDEHVARGGKPTVIVIDVSGSMSGDRIESAKKSLRNVVNEQQPGTTMGIWTYPNDQNCSPGSFQVEVKQHEGTAELKESIEGLETGGGTPTGEALIEVADQLESLGYDGGNLLLVSDGEANCDVTPIEATEQIVKRGFTVSTIPFGDDDGLQEQMHEIAEAGGGVYVPVNPEEAETRVEDDQGDTSTGGADASQPGNDTDTDNDHGEDDQGEQSRQDQLFEVIQNLTQPKIDVTLTSPSILQEGDAQRIEVRLENSSVRDVIGGEFSVTSDGADGVSADPVTSIVGNLPVGSSVTRMVDVTVAPGVKYAELTVLAWGQNTPITEQKTSFDVLKADDPKLDPEPSGPITETGQGTRHLLVLGDAAVTVTETEGSVVSSELMAECTHGATVAGQQVLEWDDTTIAACTEYTGIDSLHRELQAVNDAGIEASSVLMSVGAAEIGLDAALVDCFHRACDVSDVAYLNAMRAAQELDLTDHLTQTWASVNGTGDRARSGLSAAPIFVSAYPLLFPEDRGLQCTADIGPQQMIAANLLTAQLNAGIHKSVLRAQELGVEVYYLEGSETALQRTSNVCGKEPGVWFSELNTGDGGGRAASEVTGGAGFASPMILTPSGGVRVGRSIGAWSENRERVLPDHVFSDEYVGSAGRVSVGLSPRLTFDAPAHAYGLEQRVGPGGLQKLTGVVVVQAGQRVMISGGGYAPNSLVYATVRAEGVELVGRAVADDSGLMRAEVVIPEYESSGAAELVVSGVNARNEGVRMVTDISVSAEPPFWVLLLFWGSVVFVFASLVVGVVARVSRFGRA